jgi:hypothetical protein
MIRDAALGLLLCTGLVPFPSHAFVLSVGPAPKQIYLHVGDGVREPGNNNTINLVSVSVPGFVVGNGAPQLMFTNSLFHTTYFDPTISKCTNWGWQVYLAALVRSPALAPATALLSVTTPASLTSGLDSMPFSQIRWNLQDAGTFGFFGGTQNLRTIGPNELLEDCLFFLYRNQFIQAGGVYKGRATYTLTAP